MDAENFFPKKMDPCEFEEAMNELAARLQKATFFCRICLGASCDGGFCNLGFSDSRPQIFTVRKTAVFKKDEVIHFFLLYCIS